MLTLTINADLVGTRLCYSYATSDGSEGQILLRYPECDRLDLRRFLPTVSTGVCVYLAQLCLADRVELAGDLPSGIDLEMEVLTGMLYDVRRWKDGTTVDTTRPGYFASRLAQCASVSDVLDPRRALLMWSGGKDSTLSAIALRDRGYDVTALHVTINQGVQDSERTAVNDLAEELRIDLLTVEYEHEHFLEFSSRYAKEWNRFPRCNVVPFGRDLLLATIAAPVAIASTCQSIVFGHDNECRHSYVQSDGHRFPRNDVESAEGAAALQHLLQLSSANDLRILAPLAMLSELRILLELVEHHPGLFARTSFCFWGGNCGRCAKCLRYNLAQRLAGEPDLLMFRENPLATGVNPELADLLAAGVRGGVDDGLLFQRQVVYCLARLVQRGELKPGDDAVTPHIDDLRALLPDLDRWADDLLVPHAMDEVPPDIARYWMDGTSDLRSVRGV